MMSHGSYNCKQCLVVNHFSITIVHTFTYDKTNLDPQTPLTVYQRSIRQQPCTGFVHNA